MSEQIGREELDRLVGRLRSDLGESLQAIGVAWSDADVEFPHVRDDVAERFGRDVLVDVAVDLLADRHLEVGNLRRHGLEGPTVSGRIYGQALLVVCWDEALPVGVMIDPEPDRFGPAADALREALARHLGR